MANRQQRRAEARRNEKMAKLFKNGITQTDLDEAYNKGFRKGYHDRAWQIIQSYYGATMLALHDEFGFGQGRCIRVLKAIEENLVKCLTNTELIEEVEKKIGVEIHLDDALNRAQPMDKSDC